MDLWRVVLNRHSPGLGQSLYKEDKPEIRNFGPSFGLACLALANIKREIASPRAPQFLVCNPVETV